MDSQDSGSFQKLVRALVSFASTTPSRGERQFYVAYQKLFYLLNKLCTSI